jgi:acyl-[acyl-carrier-protein]-phospholipid O-acyltransferase/long-chain-fatty-acid--[acyl-carrier-protein] ligase
MRNATPDRNPASAREREWRSAPKRTKSVPCLATPMSTQPQEALAPAMLRLVGSWIVNRFYRITTDPAPALPEGGFLLLPNHLSWVDAVLLQVACPRPIRFLVDDQLYRSRTLNPILRVFGGVPVSQKRAKEAIVTAGELLRRGEVVCIFPEGEISRIGTLLKLRRGFELIARSAGAPVVPVWLDQLWGSIFSFSEGRFFFKWPKAFPYPVSVTFGDAIPAEDATVSRVREALLNLGERAFQSRPEHRSHLAIEAVRGLMRGRSQPAVIDGMDDGRISRGTLLAAALALSGYLRRHCPERRIAIVLPPGKGAAIANLAVVLADKIPVNLNFTASADAIKAALRIAEIQQAITAEAFKEKFPAFPWPDSLLFVEKILPGLFPKIVAWKTLCAALPASVIAWIARTPTQGDRNEAIVLFTSGSSGDPKGVVLSHRNILGNVEQFSTMLGLRPESRILACLPIFHSFGSTVTLWYPILKGLQAVSFPSPLDIPKNVELIEKYGIQLLCSTPTFLRGYLRKAEAHQLRSLELIVTGAEKLPMDLADAFEARFGKEVLQGYGLTETSPVASVNLPQPATLDSKVYVQPSSRRGSTGKLAPGMAAQIRDPDTGARLPLESTGMLWLRGPNIFEGYLNDPTRTAEVLHEGWLRTGDLGRFDEDGFLFIEGRLSRFSKIAGEMVPHETIEARVYAVLELAQEEKSIAITGIPDESKGEALVLVSTREIDMQHLRLKLNEAGLPNLWIPKKIVQASEIPHLASGKLDLRAIHQLALADQKGV